MIYSRCNSHDITLIGAAGKSFEDDDVELICSKSGLEHLQALTDALSSTASAEDQQSLLQVCSTYAVLCRAKLWCNVPSCVILCRAELSRLVLG